MVRRPHDQCESTRTQVRRPATGRTRAAESTTPGRTFEPDAAALRAEQAGVPPACLVHQARAAGRMGGILGEAAAPHGRWGPPEDRALGPVVFRTDSASR